MSWYHWPIVIIPVAFVVWMAIYSHRYARSVADYLDHIGWAGIFWQNPANDWGDKPGGVNLSKATTLVFRARGLRGGEKVTFFMGGLKDKAFNDTAEARLPDVILKKEWTRYRIPLDGLDLSCVKTGFGFTLGNDGDPFAFFLDDIQYVAD